MTRDEETLLKEKYKNEAGVAFTEDCVRLRNGEPLAYVIGWVPFLDAVIHLDSRPLIPRPETEYWTEKAIREIKDVDTPAILDLCAGSGCIGVSVLKKAPTATVDFIEIEEQHHETIRKNIIDNASRERGRVFGGDLFERAQGPYDFILANPPYIDETLERVEESVKEYEPALALYGGEHGTELIERILKAAPSFLKETGVLYLEHEPEQVTLIGALSEKAGLVVTSLPDQYGTLRYSRLTLAKGK